jgi:2-C-methyl-D-erythritol 4-phosphate cytidylyltransferase
VHHAAAPAIPVSSTVKRVEGGVVRETVDREKLFEVQTPQVFDAGLIKAALTSAIDKSINITDDCMAVELLGVPVYITEGSRNNIKLTTREDAILAEAILKKS